MSRRQVAPGVWVDEEPRAPELRYGGMLSGHVIGDMKPLMGGLTAIATTRTGGRRSFSLHRDRCLELMPSGAECRLFKGHKDHHKGGGYKRHDIPPRPNGNRVRWDDVDRCGELMRYTQQICGRVKGHAREHRDAVTLAAAAERKRARYPRRMAA